MRQLLCSLAVLASCAAFPRSLEMPDNGETTVALFSAGLPPPIEAIGRETWFAIRRRGERDWKQSRLRGTGGHYADPMYSEHSVDPMLHGMWRGADGDRAADCIDRIDDEVRQEIDASYSPWSNGNAYIDALLRRCELSASLPATAVGKDWRGLLGASVTSEGTGIQIETAIVGARVGLREGVEVHVLGLSFGVDLWPPAIIVPFGRGRLGFADR